MSRGARDRDHDRRTRREASFVYTWNSERAGAQDDREPRVPGKRTLTDGLDGGASARAGVPGKRTLTDGLDSGALAWSGDPGPGRGNQALEDHAAPPAMLLRQQAAASDELRPDHPSVTEALRSVGSGALLPEPLRQAMEQRLGADLRRVRLHADPVAAAAAAAVSARAFTVGLDIFFAAGALAPDSTDGRELLAHELVHVVQAQQGRISDPGGRVQVSDPHGPLEQEAAQIGRRVAGGDMAAVAAPGAQPVAVPGAQPAAPAGAPPLVLHRDPAQPGPAPVEVWRGVMFVQRQGLAWLGDSTTRWAAFRWDGAGTMLAPRVQLGERTGNLATRQGAGDVRTVRVAEVTLPAQAFSVDVQLYIELGRTLAVDVVVFKCELTGQVHVKGADDADLGARDADAPVELAYLFPPDPSVAREGTPKSPAPQRVVPVWQASAKRPPDPHARPGTAQHAPDAPAAPASPTFPTSPPFPTFPTFPTFDDAEAFDAFAASHPEYRMADILTKAGKHVPWVLTAAAITQLADKVRKHQPLHPGGEVVSVHVGGAKLAAVSDLAALYFPSVDAAMTGADGATPECEVYGMEGGTFGRKDLGHADALLRWKALENPTDTVKIGPIRLGEVPIPVAEVRTLPGHAFQALRVQGSTRLLDVFPEAFTDAYRKDELERELDPSTTALVEGKEAIAAHAPTATRTFILRAGSEAASDFYITFELHPGPSMFAADEVTVLAAPKFLDAMVEPGELRTFDNAGNPSTRGSHQCPTTVAATPLERRYSIRRGMSPGPFRPTVLASNSQELATERPGHSNVKLDWSFDWDGDDHPDFAVALSVTGADKDWRSHVLELKRDGKVVSRSYLSSLWGGNRPSDDACFAPRHKERDLIELLGTASKETWEIVVTSLPVVGELVMLGEALSGQTMFGEKMTPAERVITGILAVLPGAGGLARDGIKRAIAAARAAGKTEDEVNATIGAVERATGGERDKLTGWLGALRRGDKLATDAMQALRKLLERIQQAVRLSRATNASAAVRDFATLLKQDDVVVGKLLESADEGQAILRGLADGDAGALTRLGVTPPKDFDPRKIHWALGELPDGRFAIVKGGKGPVEWARLTGIKSIAGSHTYGYVVHNAERLAMLRRKYAKASSHAPSTKVYHYGPSTEVASDGVSYWQTRQPNASYKDKVLAESTVGELRGKGELRLDEGELNQGGDKGDALILLHNGGEAKIPGSIVERRIRGYHERTGEPFFADEPLPDGPWRDAEGNVYYGHERVRSAPARAEPEPAPKPEPEPSPSSENGRGSGTPAPESPPGSNVGCFVAGTTVATPEGPRSIEALAVGSRVIARDLAAGGVVVGEVTRTFTHVVPVVLDLAAGGAAITCSPEHPFWAPGVGWRRAGELSPGDLVLDRDGRELPIASIAPRRGAFTVHNIEVAGTHCYHVSAAGILVHNKPLAQNARQLKEEVAAHELPHCKDTRFKLVERLRKPPNNRSPYRAAWAEQLKQIDDELKSIEQLLPDMKEASEVATVRRDLSKTNRRLIDLGQEIPDPVLALAPGVLKIPTTRPALDAETILVDYDRFTRTSHKFQGRTIYRDARGYSYYVDNLHCGEASEIEMFDRQGNHQGTLHVDGRAKAGAIHGRYLDASYL